MMLLFITYILHNQDFINASFFIIAGFLLSSVFSLLNLDIWQLNVSGFTVFIITSGLIAFVFGDLIGNLIRVRLRLRITFDKSITGYTTDYINIKTSVTVFNCIFMAIVDYFYFRFIYNLSLIRGNRFGIAGMFQYARYLIVDGRYDSSLPTLLGHGNVICECLGYLYLFVYIYNYIFSKKIITINALPCILYVINAGISTARFNFLKYFVAAVVMALIILSKENIQFRKFRFRTLVAGVAGFIILLWGFRMLGYLTGKSAVRSLWSDISVYIGSSIPAFDYYLTTPFTPNEFFGKETLANVYKMLRRVNMTDVPAYSIPLPFIRLANGRDTNVYTIFRSLIQDYGYIAMYFILVAEGLFYGSFTRYVKTKREVGLGIIIFAYMIYPVFFSCIEEKFILNFTAINLVYHLIYFCILYRLIIRRPIIITGVV